METISMRETRATDGPIDAYLRLWNLKPDGAIVETHTSWGRPVVYQDAKAFLKVPKLESDEVHAATMLEYLAGNGAVRLIRADENAHLMERACGGRSLSAMAVSGQDDQAASFLADTVARLHAARPTQPPFGLPTLRHWFTPLFEAEGQSDRLARGARVARRLLDSEREAVPLHGDLHHDNVLDGEGRGWLAIDPKGIVGERTYDVANLLVNPWGRDALVQDAARMRRHAVLYARRLALDASRVLGYALAHTALSVAWSIEDRRDPAFRLRCMEILDPLVE